MQVIYRSSGRMHQQKTLLQLLRAHFSAQRQFTVRQVRELVARLGYGALRGKEQETLAQLVKKSPVLQHVRYGVYQWRTHVGTTNHS